jgi:SAM-dependent methyltransferase
MTERFHSIIDAYEAGYRAHGDSPAALLGAKGRQHIRFEALLPLLRSGAVTSLLDYGCGLGHLLSYLRSHGWPGAYHGVDIVESFVAHARARQHPGATFELIQPGSDIGGTFDVVYASGVFNLRSHDDAAESKHYALERLAQLFDRSRQFLVCDFMTDYVDFRQEGAQHWHPAELMDFAVARLTRRFVVRHDLLPYEFSIVFYKDFGITRPDNAYTSAARV